MNARVMNIRSEYREACVPRFGGNCMADRSFWKRAQAKAIRRIDAVGEDLAANGASLCRDADAYDDGSDHDECRKCVACIDCGDCECRRAT